jgi:hypothetical protein
VYGKVFDSIYDGTLYGHWEAIITMQQFIVLANQDGVVDMTVAAICARTSIPQKIIEKGIAFLEAPDPFTRTPGDDGRRIVLIDAHRPWGWRLVNHGKYTRLRNMAEKREADRVRIEEKRLQNNDVAIVSQMSPSVANVAHVDVDVDINKDKRNNSAVALPDWLPQEPWDAWLEVRKKNRAPNTPRALRLAVAELARLKAAGNDPQAVLEQSTLRGWRGVFEIKAARGSAPDYSAVIEGLKD